MIELNNEKIFKTFGPNKRKSASEYVVRIDKTLRLTGKK